MGIDKRRALALSAILFAALCVAVWARDLVSGDYFPARDKSDSRPVAFDNVAWRSAPDSCLSHIRLQMLDDLRSNHLFVGMTRSEVLDLLGPPDWPQEDSASTIVFCLGPEGWFFPTQSQWLGVDFDSDGRLASTRVYVR